MALGALFIGIFAGLVSFATTIVAGYGFLLALLAYMGAGSIVTALILIVACTKPRRGMPQLAQTA